MVSSRRSPERVVRTGPSTACSGCAGALSAPATNAFGSTGGGLRNETATCFLPMEQSLQLVEQVEHLFRGDVARGERRHSQPGRDRFLIRDAIAELRLEHRQAGRFEDLAGPF